MTNEQASGEFLAVFAANADRDGAMSFARFVELALYHPEVGYYRAARRRIGRGGETDFFTATSSGPLFGELVVAAAVKLLGGRDPKAFAFVEIGAEPGEGVLRGVGHPFGSAACIGVGETLALPPRSVVFSNELFDAQPFRRFVRRATGWREIGVAVRDLALVAVDLETAIPAELPAELPEGYVLDAPFAAAGLVDQISQPPWSGLFIACDYGKSWRELIEATPQGTARAYHRHRQSNDLLARPGEQDLTCHVCWDWLADALSRNGFAAPALESQEAFFVRHSGEVLAQISADEAARFSARKQSLFQLLHPAHLGQKFQVLHASRFGRAS